MLPQNQPPIMPSMHQYSQMAQTEIGQDLWDHEKHVRAQRLIWRNIHFHFFTNLSFHFRIKDGQNGLTSQLALYYKAFRILLLTK